MDKIKNEYSKNEAVVPVHTIKAYRREEVLLHTLTKGFFFAPNIKIMQQ
jgi:hypothetical protein